MEQGGSLTIEGSSLFGNDIRARDAALATGARRQWIEPNILIPAGDLEKYYIYVKPNRTILPAGTTEAEIRLQIWRPVPNQERAFVLVFQEIVTVSLTFTNGALYEVNMTINYNLK